jgi:hypothetical protein
MGHELCAGAPIYYLLFIFIIYYLFSNLLQGRFGGKLLYMRSPGHHHKLPRAHLARHRLNCCFSQRTSVFVRRLAPASTSQYINPASPPPHMGGLPVKNSQPWWSCSWNDAVLPVTMLLGLVLAVSISRSVKLERQVSLLRGKLSSASKESEIPALHRDSAFLLRAVHVKTWPCLVGCSKYH